MRLRIVWKSGEIHAQLDDTSTTSQLLRILPHTFTANMWGDEVYFSVPVQAELEDNAQQVVDAGTVCFWVEGQSMAIPFGPTPITCREERRLAPKVNLLGNLEGDVGALASIRDGDAIRIELSSRWGRERS